MVDSENLNGTLQEFDNTYDADGRLVRQVMDPNTSNQRTFTYTYDLAGNRVASTNSGAPAGQQSLAYVYDADGRLTTVTGTVGYQVSGQNGGVFDQA